MSFSNIFDSSLIDYSSDFQEQDNNYLENIKKSWYEKIEKRIDLYGDKISKDEFGYYVKDTWEALYDYTINRNGEGFNGAAYSGMIDIDIPTNKDIVPSYLGTLNLTIYVSKPKKEFTIKYDKQNNKSILTDTIIGDPNTYFKYRLVDLSQGYNLVKTGKVFCNIEQITDQLDNPEDKRKMLNYKLEKLYDQIKEKAIKEIIDYILENY